MPPNMQYAPPALKPKKRWGLWLSFFFVLILLCGMTYAAVYSYLQWQDYKNNADKKISDAVQIASQQVSTKKDNEFKEEEKKPHRTYKGPEDYGNISFEYPKTWSGYVIVKDATRNQIEGYFHPDVLPDINGGTSFALRIQLIDAQFGQVSKDYEANIKTGKITWTPYSAPQVQNIVGAYIKGEIDRGKKETMVLLPLRDKTLKIWAEAETFEKDFNDIILASLKFTP